MLGFDPHTTRSGQPRTRRSRLVISYIPDYFVLVVMAVVWGLMSIIHPFHRDFSLTDKTIQYRYKPDSVPFYAAVILSFVAPLAIIVAWTGLGRRSFHDMNAGILGLCISLVLNMMITNTVKNLAGRLRPDFIARCNLDTKTAMQLEPAIGLVTSAICKPTDEKVFLDGMRSFPSGHTSFAFAGMTYLSLWLAGHMHIADGRGRTYKSFVALVPELAAMLIGISRTKDYRHHWQDVLAGALLGVFMGWFGYHQYYPSPSSRSDDPSVPYPPRIPEDDAQDAMPYGLKPLTRVVPNPDVQPAPGAPVVRASGSIYSQHFAPPHTYSHSHTQPQSQSQSQSQSQLQLEPRIPSQAHRSGDGAELMQSRDSLVASSYHYRA